MFEIYVLDSTRFNDCMVSWFVHTVDSMHPRKMYECIWSFGDNIMYSFAHTSYVPPTNKRVISGSGVTSYIFFFKYLFFCDGFFTEIYCFCVIVIAPLLQRTPNETNSLWRIHTQNWNSAYLYYNVGHVHLNEILQNVSLVYFYVTFDSLYQISRIVNNIFYVSFELLY